VAMTIDITYLAQSHPRFQGNPEDIAEFLRLKETPLHSEQRGNALMQWQAYNTLYWRKRKRGDDSVRRLLRKVDVSYGPRHVDLRGADFGVCCLGRVNLRAARLDEVDFEGSMFKAADFKEASFRGANLQHCRFLEADLRQVDFRGADLRGANFEGARLEEAIFDADTRLAGACFYKAHLMRATLECADLRDVDLRLASLVGANLRGANLEGAKVYGCAAWDVVLDDDSPVQRAHQSNLSIDPSGAALPSADSLELAQFISLLLNNPKLRTVLDTVTSRGVLILGRFTPERKVVLDAVRQGLGELGYYPMLFDFSPLDSRDKRETIKILAGLSAFVLADVSDASSVPLELETLVTDFVIPFVIVKQHTKSDFAMLDTLYHRAENRLSEPNSYKDAQHLVNNLADLAAWASDKAQELNALKRSSPKDKLLPGG